MSLGKGIIGDTAINLAALAIGIVGAVALQSVLAWHLGPVGRGEYGVWLAIANIAAVVCTLGTDRAIQVQLISNRINVSQATCTCLTVGIGGSVIAIAILWSSFEYHWQCFAEISRQSRLFALLVVPATVLPLALQMLLSGLRHFVAIAVINMLRAILQIAMALCLFIVFPSDTRAAYATFALGGVMTVVACLLVISWHHKLQKAFIAPHSAREILGYSLRYLPARVGNVVNSNLVLLILALFASKHDIGVFALTIAVMEQTLVLSNALERAIQPRLDSQSEDHSRLIAKCCRTSVAVYAGIMLILPLVLGVATPLLFSSSFHECTQLFWIMAPGYWLKGATKPLRTYFVGSNRPGMVSIALLVELSTTMYVLAVLYPLWGRVGAALSATIGIAVSCLLLATAFRYTSKRSFADTWLWTRADTLTFKFHCSRFAKALGTKIPFSPRNTQSA